ncbi:MAG: hypothetical protein ACREJO_13525 [Phycisphaerales bacterium]
MAQFSTTPPPTTNPAGERTITRLVLLRRAMRAMLLLHRAGWIVAGAIALGVTAAVIDYWLRWPNWLRCALLALTASALVITAWRALRPILAFRPSVEDLALRLERSSPGAQAGLRGYLASGVGLTADRTPMAQPVVAAAAGRFSTVSLSRLLNPVHTLVAVALAGIAVLGLSGLSAAEPTLSWIGVRRVLLPWTDASWPKRTEIADITPARIHPLGAALPLQAALLKSPRPDEQTRVDALFRLIDDGRAGPTRRVTMTNQQRAVRATHSDERGIPQPVSGTLFERLIEPAALAGVAGSSSSELEFWFATDDDETTPVRVKLVTPPAVVSAEVKVTPPAYAASAIADRTADLGPGNDERAGIAGIVAGSRIALTIRLNKPVPMPKPGDSAAFGVWLGPALGEPLASAVREGEGDAAFAGDSLVVSWRADRSLRIPVHITDEHNIESVSESAFRVEVVPDRAPEVTITEPAQDTDVLPNSLLPWTAEARDDIAVASVLGTLKLAKRPKGSEGGLPEPIGDERSLEKADAPPAPTTPARTLSVRGTLDIAASGAKPGEELWLSAIALDAYPDQAANGRPSRAPVRKVRVISEEQFVEQVWSELAGVRRTAIKLAEQQERARQDVQRGKDSGQAAREQAQLGESVSRAQESVAKLKDRVEKAGLKDQDLSGMLREVRDLAQRARESSSEASRDLRDSAEADQQNKAQQSTAARDAAQQAQDKTARTLEQIAEALDRGQDAWAAKRGLERLVQDQQKLREQTAQLGQETVGKSAQDLTDAQRQQMNDLGEQQESLAKRAEDTIKKMMDKAEQLNKTDPTTASALQQAAQRGQRANVSDQMQQTAQQIKRNQQQSATQQQDAASRTLEQMLEELKQAQQNRDAVLKRELASLIESLDTLIRIQTTQLAAIDTARPTGAFTGLDGAMIKLHTATLAVADQARAAGRETRPVAELIDAAAVAQQKAIVSLRAAPVEADAARESEATSLEKLTAARAEARKLSEQAQKRDEQRQRGELKRAYRELLLQQTELKGRVDELAGATIDRRLRNRARELGDQQEQVKLKAKELVEKTKELSDSEVFSLAHERLDDNTAAAAALLREPKIDADLTLREASAVRILQAIVESLNEDDNKDDFRENDNGGGSGQQGGQQKPQGVIPPIAQLKLLRSMQSEALTLTRQAAETPDPAAAKNVADTAAKLQADLTTRAEALMKKMEEQQRPRPMTPPAPNTPPAPQPGDNP